MSTLDFTKTIELDGAQFAVVGHEGTFVHLKNLATGVLRNTHIGELAGQVSMVRPTRQVRDLDRIPDEHRDRVRRMEGHLLDLLGQDPTRRAEYDPATTTLQSRLAAKVKQTAGTADASSEPTWKRRLRAYKEHGLVGLIDGRALRQHGSMDLIDDRVVGLLHEVVAAQTYKSTGTVSRLIRELNILLVKHYPGQDIPVPSEKTLYRKFKELSNGRYTTGSATTRRSRENVTKQRNLVRRETLPGAEVQVDSHVMDVEVLSREGKRERLVLTLAIDVATRCILGYTFRTDAANGYDHTLLLAQCLTTPANRPDRSAQRAELRRILDTYGDAVQLLPEEQRQRLEAHRPFAYPRRFMVDNGKDFVSETFRAACQYSGVDLTIASPYTPSDKGKVERMFRTINTMFAQYLPGYVGSSPVHRGRRVPDEDLLTIDMLHELFDDWVLSVYHHSPHSGLRDRFSGQLCTPYQAYAAATAVHGQVDLPISEQEYIALLPTEWRVIGKLGVQVNNRHYDSDALTPHRHQLSNIPGQDGKWEVKVNPYDPTVVWVRDLDGAFIPCHDRHLGDADMPYAGETARARMQARADHAREDAARTGTPMPEAPADMYDAAGSVTFDPTSIDPFITEDEEPFDFDSLDDALDDPDKD